MAAVAYDRASRLLDLTRQVCSLAVESGARGPGDAILILPDQLVMFLIEVQRIASTSAGSVSRVTDAQLAQLLSDATSKLADCQLQAGQLLRLMDVAAAALSNNAKLAVGRQPLLEKRRFPFELGPTAVALVAVPVAALVVTSPDQHNNSASAGRVYGTVFGTLVATYALFPSIWSLVQTSTFREPRMAAAAKQLEAKQREMWAGVSQALVHGVMEPLQRLVRALRARNRAGVASVSLEIMHGVRLLHRVLDMLCSFCTEDGKPRPQLALQHLGEMCSAK
jgi:hypothetical protein